MTDTLIQKISEIITNSAPNAGHWTEWAAEANQIIELVRKHDQREISGNASDGLIKVIQAMTEAERFQIGDEVSKVLRPAMKIISDILQSIHAPKREEHEIPGNKQLYDALKALRDNIGVASLVKNPLGKQLRADADEALQAARFGITVETQRESVNQEAIELIEILHVAMLGLQSMSNETARGRFDEYINLGRDFLLRNSIEDGSRS